MVGNFIGDFVRGRNIYEQFKPNIALGIELHREIDEFTDSHSVVMESKKRLRPKYRHYSPVIVDMFYDHFLAKNWQTYHSNPLDQFVSEAYATLNKFEDQLPQRVQGLLPHIIRGNWLYNYSRIEGIHGALSGMSRRTPYESKMDEAVLDLQKFYTEFEDEFSRFFPELQQISNQFLKLKQD
ncbi:MAG: acyl carrier protein phosphodiesterase [Cyclobacteriaceae bacterium]